MNGGYGGYTIRQVWIDEGEVRQRYIDPKDVYIQPEESMGRGLSRAFIGMATGLVAAIAQQNGVPVNKVFDQPKPKRRRILPSLGLRSSWSEPHQGAQECARRLKQGINGTQYVHGAQYDGLPYCGRPPWHWKEKR